MQSPGTWGLATSWLLALAWLAAGCAASTSGMSPAAPRDAIVVLGHHPARDERGLEPETAARTMHGIALFRAQRAPLLVFTGGHTSPGPSEAEIMSEFAAEAGVPEAAIRRESASRDTIENARLTVALLSAELARAPRVLVVTSDYHEKRAARLFRCAGADVQSEGVALHALSGWQRFQRKTREVAVHVMYWFIDECARVRGHYPG